MKLSDKTYFKAIGESCIIIVIGQLLLLILCAYSSVVDYLPPHPAVEAPHRPPGWLTLRILFISCQLISGHLKQYVMHMLYSKINKQPKLNHVWSEILILIANI